jgi:hypothetical protein
MSHSSISQNEQHTNQFGYNDNSLEKLVLDEAEQSYNRIVEALTNNCVEEMPDDTKSSDEIFQVPDMQHEASHEEGPL